MHSPLTIAKLCFETFDRSAVRQFRDFLSLHPGISKWLIAADFALHDAKHPLDCMAFSIFPYDTELSQIKADVDSVLPKDLKESKQLTAEGAAWLRDKRRFHVVITMNKKRAVFNNGAGTKEKEIAREHIALTVRQLSGMIDGQGPQMRFKKLQQKSAANNFKVGLLGDIWLLGVLFSALTLMLGRERTCEVVSWFPDRDKMTSFGDGVWLDYAFWNTRGLCEELQVDMQSTKIGAAAPDRSGGKEVMWFDYMIRSADWFAGTLATWDRAKNQVPPEQRKYCQVLEDAIADAENILVLHCDIDEGGAQFRRIAVSKGQASQTGETLPLTPEGGVSS